MFSVMTIPMHSFAYVPSIHPHDKPVITIKPNQFNPVSPVVSDEMILSTANDHTMSKIAKKKWGIDNEYPNEYWFDDRIHTLGNHGFWGAIHAAVAPMATKMIDVSAYHGVDIRQKLAHELSTLVGKQQARVADLCCGVGFSTRALQNAFPEADTVIGIDTSKEMVAMANFLTNHLNAVHPLAESALLSQISDSYQRLKKKGYAIKRAATYRAIRFLQGNAERTELPHESFDLVTVMWAFHEAPMHGRDKILQEARRLLSPGGVLAVIDISTDYVPSETMLKGEPYVKEYQQNIHQQLEDIHGFEKPTYRTVIPNHLGMWTLTRLTPAIA